MSCANGANPVVIPFTNVTVAGSTGQARGMAIEIGNPPQVLALRPATYQNDSYIRNSGDCATTNNACIAEMGGAFLTGASKSYETTSLSAWNGTDRTGAYPTYFNDQLRFGENSTLYGYPLIRFAPNAQGDLSFIGVGSNSTFTRGLYATNGAPSKVVGIYTGSDSVDDPADGSVVVGGYDESFVSGTFMDFGSASYCATCAYVTGMDLHVGGTTQSMFPSGVTSVQASLDPGPSFWQMNGQFFSHFLNITNAQLLSEDLGYGWRTGQQPGDLTVTFDSGYRVTIPAGDLFVPPRGYDDNGKHIISNSSFIATNFVNMSNPSLIPIWGQPFFSNNYMIFDGVQSRFRLANVNRHPTGTSIKAVCDPDASIPPSSAIPTPSNTGTGSGDSNNGNKNGGGSNAGAIAGGVVGGVIGLALIAFLAWFILRRRNKAKRNNSKRSPGSTEGAAVAGAGAQRTHEKSELPSYGVQELHDRSQYNPGQGQSPYSGTGSPYNQSTPSYHQTTEMPADARYEMPAEYNRPELGTGR